MELLLNKIIVTNYGENTISIIDKGNLSYINTIDLKAIIPARKGITRAILEDKQTLLVLDSDNDSLYRIDLNKRELLKQLNLGRCPFRIKSYKDRIFVTNLDSNSLSIIDKDEFSIIENIYLGEKPTDLAIDEDSGKLFITNLNSYSISIVDYENDEVAQIKLPYMPFRVKVDKNGFYILGFINNNTLNSSMLTFFSKNNIGKWERVIEGIYFDFFKDRDRDLFYLVASEDSWLYEFDKNADIHKKKVYIGGLTNFINYDLGFLYLNDMVNDKIIVVDINDKQIKRIAVGKEPHDILLT